MIQIGDYRIEWVESEMAVPNGKPIIVPVLYLTKPSGEMMGCSPDNYLKLLAMLDQFWGDQF